MAFSLSSSSSNLLILLSLFSLLIVSYQQPPLNSAEQDSVFRALESVNPTTPWRSLFPEDLCLSAPHGVVCGFLPDNNDSSSKNDTVLVPHIIELNFGYVFDSDENPPCSPNSTFPLSIFTLPHLRKLFFYRCFTLNPVSLPVFEPGFGSELEELVFMENPSLSGSLNGTIGNFTALRRLILTGSNITGGIPDEITLLPSLEQLTISGNSYLGYGNKIPINLGKLGKLRVLDLSSNFLEGTVPESLGHLNLLLKLDLSSNRFVGKIPDSLKRLQNLEFLDLSYNNFMNSGIPLFLGEMPRLREVYLSGNPLGGAIPEIWENLRGILGIGLSRLGLVGSIPSSMGVYLRNVSYIGLDNNHLEGQVPKEFELLEHVNEMNFQNNHLSGRIPFSAPFATRLGGKLKVEGNPGLCIDKSIRWSIERFGSLKKLKSCNNGTQIPNVALFNGSPSLYLNWYIVILFVGFLSFSLLL